MVSWPGTGVNHRAASPFYSTSINVKKKMMRNMVIHITCCVTVSYDNSAGNDEYNNEHNDGNDPNISLVKVSTKLRICSL